MAAVHLGSFNQCYITHGFNEAALAEVSTRFVDKTLDGYRGFWQEQIDSARDPANKHFVMVAETRRWINGREQDSIEATANIIPTSETIWERIKSGLPAELQNARERTHNFDLIHIRDGFRRAGIGNAMLDLAARMSLAVGSKAMLLMAFDGNGSPAWFKKNGFEEAGDFPLPYGGIEPLWNVTYHPDIEQLSPANDNRDLSSSPLHEIDWDGDLRF